jgi:hypothetical protein
MGKAPGRERNLCVAESRFKRLAMTGVSSRGELMENGGIEPNCGRFVAGACLIQNEIIDSAVPFDCHQSADRIA